MWRLEEIANYLEELGSLKRQGDEVVPIEGGVVLVASIRDVGYEIANLIEMALGGLSSDLDIYAHLFTGVVSIVGVIEGWHYRAHSTHSRIPKSFIGYGIGTTCPQK